MNDKLTINNLDELSFPMWEDRLGDIQDISTDRPAVAGVDILAVADMPKAYRRYYERLEAKRLRAEKTKKLRALGKAKKPGARGRRHWSSKAATERRRRAKLWAERPFDCILMSDHRKCKRMDRQLWEAWITPIWTEPSKLSVKFPHGSGTRLKPWSMFNIEVWHTEKGKVFNGPDLELYILSGG